MINIPATKFFCFFRYFFKCSNYHFKSVSICTPRVGFIFERYKIGFGKDDPILAYTGRRFFTRYARLQNNFQSADSIVSIL